jgi:hypothetical protein
MDLCPRVEETGATKLVVSPLSSTDELLLAFIHDLAARGQCSSVKFMVPSNDDEELLLVIYIAEFVSVDDVTHIGHQLASRFELKSFRPWNVLEEYEHVSCCVWEGYSDVANAATWAVC